MPVPIVAATFSEMNAPTKFSVAARPRRSAATSRACRRRSTIAFAVSWNPFVKSKPRAVITTITRTMSPLMIRRS